MNIAGWLDTVRADVAYGLRQLKANPGFTAIAVVSLALGIGANTAIFQLVNAIRLKTLPVQNPHELVSIDFPEGSLQAGWWPTRGASMTYPQWEQIRALREPFTGALAWSSVQFNLATGGEPRIAQSLYVSGDFFRQLGVGAILGRTFVEQDDSPACNVGAVLSYAFWQREFGGDPAILGRTVSLDGHTIPILGVTPPSFYGLRVGSRYDVAIPFCANPLMSDGNRGWLPQRDTWWLSAMARLKPGWTVKSANTYLGAVSPQIIARHAASGVPTQFSEAISGEQADRVTGRYRGVAAARRI